MDQSSERPTLLHPVQGEGVTALRGNASEQALKTTRLLRFLIHCHIMDHLGQKEPEKKDACIQIYCLPRNVQNRFEPGDNDFFFPKAMPF